MNTLVGLLLLSVLFGLAYYVVNLVRKETIEKCHRITLNDLFNNQLPNTSLFLDGDTPYSSRIEVYNDNEDLIMTAKQPPKFNLIKYLYNLSDKIAIAYKKVDDVKSIFIVRDCMSDKIYLLIQYFDVKK
jgi:hypothetical protein